ncbi:DUF3836 domain-containing protein [Dysgonomonas sp. ZJ709]|uniref:DUF3836 domain-containing protein n=1 Tax=Dysgonomonas sp. ZJ709 TaxID=2709797 RepID=UPI0013ED264E|nr:DUF3836 domain-containing protein [Dysgonomonas sp. ZJ709]
MKTKTFILIAVLFSSVSLFSQQRGTIVYNNIDNTGSVTTKECIAVDKQTLAPLTKSTYIFDADGNKIEKVVYTWSNSGWVAKQKNEYQCASSNQLASLIYTEWNAEKSEWSDKSEYLLHTYNDGGEWVATSQMRIDNTITNLVTEK